MFCQDLCRGNWDWCWQKHCGFTGFFKFLLWFAAVRVLSKMTRADKSWNIFPTAHRFQFFKNSMDSHISMRTICGTVNHRTVWILISTWEPFVVQLTTEQYRMFTYPRAVYTVYKQMQQPVFSFVLYVTTWSIPNTDSLLSLISVLIAKTTDYIPCWRN